MASISLYCSSKSNASLTVNYTNNAGSFTVNSIVGHYSYGKAGDATKTFAHSISYPGGSSTISTLKGSYSSGSGYGWDSGGGYTWGLTGNTTFSGSGSGKLSITIASGGIWGGTVWTSNEDIVITDPKRHVNGYIRNQNANGTWGDYWHWINEDVDAGTTKTYTGYTGDAVYQQVQWSGTINSDTNFYLDAYRNTFAIDINAYQPNGSTQNGLKFNMTDSRGNSWTDLTNEPSGFTRRYGETATINNIRSNVTGAHYTKNNVTGTAASSFSFTFDSTKTITMSTAWNTYTIAYNANGGSGAPSSQTKTYNTNLTLRTGKPTRPNYKFLGWSTSSTARTASYSAGGTLSTDLSTTQGATVTLYAVWTPALKVITSSGVVLAPIKIINSNGTVTIPKNIKKI